MISVENAEKFVLDRVKYYGTESVPIEASVGRVLTTSIIADRDYPAGNRSTMDGIAVNFAYLKQNNRFLIKDTQPAGVSPVGIVSNKECIKVMTGSILDPSVDTVIKIEDIKIDNCYAVINIDDVVQNQFVHLKGSDCKKDSLVIEEGTIIGPKEIGVLSSTGYSEVEVAKLPKVSIMTTGDELVNVVSAVKDYEVRQSNDYVVRAVLQRFQISPSVNHLPDNKEVIKKQIIKDLKNNDVLIISGGVSKGEFDYVHSVLEDLRVKKIFHGVSQRPGKPFWFGKKNGKIVFAFPGNPVSTFLCLYRYLIPWLEASLGKKPEPPAFAVCDDNFQSSHDLTLFIPVKISIIDGKLVAQKIDNNGSGDITSLISASAFMEISAGAQGLKDTPQKIWRIE